MSYNPASGFPRIMPSLRYADVGKALIWLSHAFGLKEHLRWADENGIVRHAEMRIDTAFIEVAQAPEGSVAPKRLGQMWQSLVVLVDDVDIHYQRSGARKGSSWSLRLPRILPQNLIGDGRDSV